MTTNAAIERGTLTVKELAELLGIAEGTAYEYLMQGLIPARKLGKKWLISRSVVMQWLENSPAVPIAVRR